MQFFDKSEHLKDYVSICTKTVFLYFENVFSFFHLANSCLFVHSVVVTDDTDSKSGTILKTRGFVTLYSNVPIKET
jgi:hypothetical protein